MAEAIVTVDMVRCDVCDQSIHRNNWIAHRQKCENHEEKTLETTENYDEEENALADPVIPCEFCESLVLFRELDRHSKQCAADYRRRYEQAQRDFLAQSIDLQLPCEFCNAPIKANELERHSIECRRQLLSVAPNSVLTENDPSRDDLIPCEVCSQPIPMENYDRHSRECAQAQRQAQQTSAQNTGSSPSNDLIPCELCGEAFSANIFTDHQTACQNERQRQAMPAERMFGTTLFPDTWDLSSFENLTRHIILPTSNEYKTVEAKFNESLSRNQIVQIERIQNRRWYRQYDAHRDDFIDRYGQSTEQWLFHGCRSESAEMIVKDCFNRSHATRCAVGQGIYFATQAATSLNYTQLDHQGYRHMFMARVLVGRTTGGSPTTRVCPAGFDTTGGGGVFVTYHDAQAYGEYLITFK